MYGTGVNPEASRSHSTFPSKGMTGDSVAPAKVEETVSTMPLQEMRSWAWDESSQYCLAVPVEKVEVPNWASVLGSQEDCDKIDSGSRLQNGFHAAMHGELHTCLDSYTHQVEQIRTGVAWRLQVGRGNTKRQSDLAAKTQMLAHLQLQL